MLRSAAAIRRPIRRRRMPRGSGIETPCACTTAAGASRAGSSVSGLWVAGAPAPDNSRRSDQPLACTRTGDGVADAQAGVPQEQRERLHALPVAVVVDALDGITVAALEDCRHLLLVERQGRARRYLHGLQQRDGFGASSPPRGTTASDHGADSGAGKALIVLSTLRGLPIQAPPSSRASSP